jgi:hypothetical protein
VRVVRPTIALTVTDGEFRNLDHAEPSNSETPNMSGRCTTCELFIKTSRSDLCLWIHVLGCASQIFYACSVFLKFLMWNINVSANTCDIAWFIGGLVI